jgi:hypothetical protein
LIPLGDDGEEIPVRIRFARFNIAYFSDQERAPEVVSTAHYFIGASGSGCGGVRAAKYFQSRKLRLNASRTFGHEHSVETDYISRRRLWALFECACNIYADFPVINKNVAVMLLVDENIGDRSRNAEVSVLRHNVGLYRPRKIT